MHLRKMLTAAAAVTAAGVMVLAPTAAHAANNIAVIEVNGATSNANDAIALTFKSATADFASYHIVCTGGSASGTVAQGTGGLTPAAGMTLSSLTLACPSFISGGTVSMNLNNCSIPVVFADTVTNGVDTDVDGVASMTVGGVHCVTVTITPPGCSLQVGGTVDVGFNETVATKSGVPYQDLTLRNSSLAMYNATGLCGFLIPSGTAITLAAVFNVHTPVGTYGAGINFKP